MGKFVLTEHLPSSVSQYLGVINDGSTSTINNSEGEITTHLHTQRSPTSFPPSPTATTHHNRSHSELPVAKFLTSSPEESNGTAATGASSDEELSSICAEENVEVIHSLRIGGSEGRLSPSFATSTIYPTAASTSKGQQQQKKKRNHRKTNSTRAFFTSPSGRKFSEGTTGEILTVVMPLVHNDEGDPDSSFYLSKIDSANDDLHNMTLQLDRFGFITNLDPKGRVIESLNGDKNDDRGLTLVESQRTERREKKWNGMLQGLEGKKGSSSSHGNGSSGKKNAQQQNPRSSKFPKKPIASKDEESMSNGAQRRMKIPPATASSLPQSKMAVFRTKNQKQIVRRLRKGVPDVMRGRVWSVLGGGIRVQGLYQDIVQYTSEGMLDNFKEMQQIEEQKYIQMMNLVDDDVTEENEQNIVSASDVATSGGGDLSPHPNTSSTVTTAASSHDEATSLVCTPLSYVHKDRKNKTKNSGQTPGNTASSTSPPSGGNKPTAPPQYEHDEFVTTRQFHSIQDTIERDIHRTYPRHNLFYEEDRYAQDGRDRNETNGGGADSSGGGAPNASVSNNSNSKTTTTVMLASPTETQTLIASRFCDPDMAALILNLERDIRIARIGETSAPVQPSDGASYTTTPGGQAALRRVLRAYSYYDQEVAYCQGMNFMAGMFLTLMSEEEAFWLLVAIMHNEPCEMRGMFGEGMRETHKVLFVGEKLIHLYLPRLARHFDKEHIHVTMFATQWLLTLYTSSFKFDLVFRVWDAFLGEGWKIVYRVMLALLQKYQNQLVKMSFEEILTFFRELPDRVEGSQIMEMALKIPLRKKVIAKYENEWNQQQKS